MAVRIATTLLEKRAKFQHLPELCKVRPETDHEFEHFPVIGGVRPLFMHREQVPHVVGMGYSCSNRMKMGVKSAFLWQLNVGTRAWFVSLFLTPHLPFPQKVQIILQVKKRNINGEHCNLMALWCKMLCYR
jgi:hypothetical protein